MTSNHEAITIAKMLLNITDASQDNLLATLGTIAEGDALAYTKNTNVLSEAGLLGRMIQVAYNLRGNEGLVSQSLATVSETYSTSSAYPETILLALRGFTKLKVL